MPTKVNELINEIQGFSAHIVERDFFRKVQNYETESLSNLDEIIKELADIMDKIGTTDGELNSKGILTDDLIGILAMHRIKLLERQRKEK